MYTRVESRFWQDEKMRTISDDARYLMLYLLTSPHRNVLGFYFLPEPYACFDLGWTQERFRKALRELLGNGLIKYDETVHVVLIINFLKHNPLENHNQVKSAIQKLEEIPKTSLFKDFYEAVKKHAAGKSHYSSLLEQLEKLLDEQLEKQLPKQLDKPFGKQEKEKEKEEEKEEEEIYSQQDKPVDTRTQTPTPYKQIADLYNSICISMPKVEQLTEKRKKHIKVMWTNFKQDISKFRELFERAEASDFLSGRNGRWVGCSFDWLIIYNNAVKVLEGVYDNKASPQNQSMKEDRFKDDEYAEFYE